MTSIPPKSHSTWSDQLRTRCERDIVQLLRRELKGEQVFPWSVRLTTPDDTWAKIQPWAMAATKHAQTNGYQLDTTEKKLYHLGTQIVPKGATFHSWDSVCSLLPNGHARREFFVTAVRTLRSAGVADSTLHVLTLGIWRDWNETLLNNVVKVLCYFQSSPFPACYLRQLPIQVGTKFIEDNQAALEPILKAIWVERNWSYGEGRWPYNLGVRQPESLFKARLLDSALQQLLLWPDDYLGIPAKEITRAAQKAATIILVENLTVLLTLPPIPGCLAIFSQGYRAANPEIEIISLAKALGTIPVHYWGDIDARGFHILSLFRAAYKGKVTSFLMDRTTLVAHSALIIQGTPYSLEKTEHLTDEEWATYEITRMNWHLLEQELIPTPTVTDALQRLFPDMVSQEQH